MTENRVIFRGTSREAWHRVQQAVAAANGDGEGVLYGLKLRIGVALLSQVQQDFIAKSRGGTGRDGIKWPPLSPTTIAQRRTTAAERKAAGLTKANRFRGLLTAEENRLWKKIYGSRLARLMHDMPLKQAKARAAQIAWAELKRRGAKTKLGLFGKRQVDILRDTGELLRSFSPGVEDRPSHAEGQIFRLEGNVIAVGSNKKPQHHRGIPKRLPARSFWPLNDEIPPPWWGAIDDAAGRGLVQTLKLLLSKSP